MGAVLAGGESSRMGTDKAFIAVHGEPMVLRAVRALQNAGAQTTVVVGGDTPRFKAMGLTTLADDHPGEGPLGAVLTALRNLNGFQTPQAQKTQEISPAAKISPTASRSAPRAEGSRLGGIVTLPCDLLSPDSASIKLLLQAAADCDEPEMREAQVIVPLGDGIPQWMHALWRSSCLNALSQMFSAGMRAPREASRRLRTTTVEVPGSSWFGDADRPGDLPLGAAIQDS